MNFKKYPKFVVIAMFAMASCKKNGAKPNQTVDVYVAGYTTYVNDRFSSVDVPTYWKNGVATKLGDSTFADDAYAIAVSGHNVYVATANGNLWKNGAAIGLVGAYSARAIVLDGNDVYVAGASLAANGIRVATYWKNGIANNLTDGSADSFATAIAVNGNNVYVAGDTKTNGGGYLATYWKNGVAKTLTDPSSNYSNAGAITVNGTDVFIVGSINNINGANGTAICWKNDVATNLAGGDYANAIVINNNDINIIGRLSLGGVYWKNGVAAKLSDESSPISNALAINGNDVYIAGRTFANNGQGLSVASYWKNGIPVQLSNNFSYAYGITVVPH